MEHWLSRTELLIGKQNIEKLKNSTVALLGCGGVGSYVAEALVRSGIGNLIIMDPDSISITNLNRQIMTDTTVIGQLKVDVLKNRLCKINPQLNITVLPIFYQESSSTQLFHFNCDYIIDAIDSVPSKLHLIEECYKRNIPIISSMGTGNKIDPSRLEITDIFKTSVCPLAKLIRKELRIRGISHLKVVYSKELPIKKHNSTTTIASISFVPSVAGLLIASEVVKDIICK